MATLTKKLTSIHGKYMLCFGEECAYSNPVEAVLVNKWKRISCFTK
jgi:hypothetical protein